MINAMSSKAIEYFSQPGHPYNCAQSVAMGAARPELAEALRTCGGGRAPDGLCGALYAALQLTPPDRHEAVRQAFARQAGALKCREIKGAAAPTPCARCVQIAAALAETAGNGGEPRLNRG